MQCPDFGRERAGWGEQIVAALARQLEVVMGMASSTGTCVIGCILARCSSPGKFSPQRVDN